MKKQDWTWMPHNGHLIVGHQCRFVLNTHVGGYIVSTVGEWWADKEIRMIHASVYDSKWHEENKHLKGDSFDRAYMKRFGYEEIGSGRLYETMVFKAVESGDKCCPFTALFMEGEVDFNGYNDPGEAFEGHIKLCNKWSKKK